MLRINDDPERSHSVDIHNLWLRLKIAIWSLAEKFIFYRMASILLRSEPQILSFFRGRENMYDQSEYNSQSPYMVIGRCKYVLHEREQHEDETQEQR